ncbi:uncharacterized protein A1O9_06578 [Exophiala aquamarina CBS 119918]|uniref:Mediator complex subunit 15 KIX domain-containing protein n=1 Tax=Exophiala aquamarina CBS 119918 TaxID=1182545 RepID=A0A072PFW4_9EURO|nr:uncharacterized protein A1O9_06578 [Exophiala aquamarina CBS 119918]KEF58652.1 hypothetical protein A1O9_06578 [Exophiala aquamarina CBS 119918]
MAGMGRGMPNNMQQMTMNPQMGGLMGGQMGAQMGGQIGAQVGNQMSNMAAQIPGMPGQMNPQMAGQMRGIPQQVAGQMSLSHPSVQQHIFDQLNSQGPWAGWQANVHIRERAGQIKLLVDSLRLVRPPVDLPRAIEVALQFERKCFSQSASREDYVRECSEKLGRIRDQRAQQMNQGNANLMQTMGMQPNMQIPNQTFQQMQQQMGQTMNPNMALPAHLQQQMQGSPFLGQQQSQQQPQQPQQQQTPQQRTPQPMMTQPQNVSAQVAMMQGNNNQQKGNAVSELTPEDNKAINLRAAELAKNTPKEEMRSIVEKMNPQLRQNLAQKAVDPIIYYFRMLATKEFRRRKQMEGGVGGAGQANNANMMNQLQQNQAMGANGNSMADMGRFQGLQAEGLRSQEGGELVVPASTSQAIMPDQMRLQQQMLAQQRMNQQNPNALNPAFIAQQQRLQQAQAAKMQQAQLQAQNQQAQAQARAQSQAALANQRGQMQGVGGNNTPLSAINRPVGANVSGTSPQPGTQAGQRPPSSTPMMNQQMSMAGNMQQGQQQQMNMQDVQKREQALANFPAPLQQLLRQKPQNEWRNILQQFQRENSGAQMRRSLSQQPAGLQQQQQQQQHQQQQQRQQQQPMTQMQNGAFMGSANIGAVNMQQSLSAGAASVPPGQDINAMTGAQNQIQQNQEMMRQRQMQLQLQQQQQGAPNVPGQAPNARPQLTPQQMKIMDQQAVPQTVLNSVRQHTRLPDVKNWFSLKQWLIQNPVPSLPVPQLLNVQANHFAHLMKTRGQNMMQQNNAMQGQIPGQQPQPQLQLQPQQQQPAPQAPVPGVPPQQAPNMPPAPAPFRSPTQQDIQKVRAANPKLANVPDEQIRLLLITRQRHLQQQSMQQPSGAQPMGQHIPGMQQQITPQMAQQQAQIQPGQQIRPPSAQGPRQTQASVQSDNKVKRPNGDDIVELAGPIANNPPVIQTDTNKGPPALNKEQFAALDPQKKQQYMQWQRQQQVVKKIFELTREVQATLPKTKPITNMDAANRNRIKMILTSDNVKNMLGRFDSFLIAFYRMEQNDAALKQLILQKMQLFSQFKPQALQNKSFELVDHFSLTADGAEAIINNITAKFQQTAAQIPQQNKPRPMAQLTPENLSLLEAQEKERKKSLGTNQAPPAPTSSQPPFQIGDKGRGTPTYAAPGFKPEDLKLDPKRRKKNNQTPATPVAQSGPSTRTTSPVATKAPKPVEMFRCPVLGCEHQLKGFSTQAELDQHHNVTHKLDLEPVTDPLAFLDESLRFAFNLDENMKQQKKPKTELKAESGTNLKGENSATPIPMSKIPSQGVPGPKAVESKTEDDYDNPWNHTNTTLDQLRVAFGGNDWDDLFPSKQKQEEMHSKMLEAYRKTSPRWRKIVEGPDGALTDTSTEKSKSPTDLSDKELPADKAMGGKKREFDSWQVNLDEIQGLDLGLGGLDMSPFENVNAVPDTDVVMGEDGSPFETIEKPQLSALEWNGQEMGLDVQHPEAWTEDQQDYADFLFRD